MTPSLEPVMTLHLDRTKEDTFFLNSTQGGAHRAVSPLVGGFLQGGNFRADFVQGGSDWVRVDPQTGTGYLDARVHFRNSDTGELFYVSFTGIVRLDPVLQKVIEFDPEAKSTEYGDCYSFINPVFEVSDPKHKWMEQAAFVGQGRYLMFEDGKSAVEFQIFKLANA